ncbi:MAG: site-2 protease family protein [Chloroflexota bacterium]|nr:site-2 protease family protein [Chloroflexota bacterium]
MFRSISLGKLAEIDVRVHPTLLLAVAWIVYEFGIATDDGAGGMLFGLTLFTAILGCVVLHEFGHSFMAREFGAATREITIYPLGGAAYIERMPADAKAEAAITIAGPLVNLAIAVCLLPIVLVAGVTAGYSSFEDFLRESIEPSAIGLLVSLLLFNIVNIVFNLIPAFPMDGGRLVRAGLSPILGRENATNVAVFFGYSIGGAMVLIGIWLFQPTLPLIGLFVMYLAYVEGKGVRIEAALRRIRVGQFALWDGGGISEDVPLKLALAGGPRDVAVVRGGLVVGMLWRRDVLNALRSGASHHLVADVMDRHFMSVDNSTSVHDVHVLMEQANRWSVPVTEDGMYRGVFTSDRLMHVYKLVSEQTSGRRRALALWASANAFMRGQASAPWSRS